MKEKKGVKNRDERKDAHNNRYPTLETRCIEKKEYMNTLHLHASFRIQCRYVCNACICTGTL